MKGILPILLLSSIAVLATAEPAKKKPSAVNKSKATAAFDEAMAFQPKLLRISGRIDGSGKIVFTRTKAHYQHKHWARPTSILIDGEPWTQLNQTPPPWDEVSRGLDLTKARVVKREGRDVIALESTPDGFDLYLSDSPNGAGDYEVIIAIPRR